MKESRIVSRVSIISNVTVLNVIRSIVNCVVILVA